MKGAFELVEGLLCIVGPFERMVFAGEGGEWFDNIGVFVNESTIKVSEPEEGLNFADVSGDRPRLDNFCFRGIHGDAVGGNYEPEVFNRGGVERTLFGFCV